MKTEYLSVKDFAERAGVSQQAIYKQVERKLNNYVKMVENQKMIDIRALQEVYGVEVEQPIQPNFDSILSQNQQMIDMLKEQLEAKDKQIENLQKLLDQAQMLNAMDKKKIESLEIKLEEPNETDPKESDEPQKGFWSRLFKK